MLIFAPSRMGRPWRAALLALLAGLLLSGCVITAGEVTGVDIQGDAGNLTSRFVSAEGAGERRIRLGAANAELQVIAIVGVASGEFQVDLVDPDGEVRLAVAAEAGQQITRSGVVQLDENGELRYRIFATNAREGAFQLFFQQ